MSKHWIFFSHFWPLTIMQSHRSSLSVLFWTKYSSYIFLVVFFLVIEMMHYTLKKFIYLLDENITLSLNSTALPVLWFFYGALKEGRSFVYFFYALYLSFLFYLFIYLFFFCGRHFFWSRTYEMKLRVWVVLQ